MGIFDDLKNTLDTALRNAQREDIEAAQAEEDLMKQELGIAPVDPKKPKTYRRVSLVDPNLIVSFGGASYGAYRPKYSLLSNRVLKEMSLRDPIVSSIIQTRINQVISFARPQQTRYETGYKIFPKDPNMEIKPNSEEEKEIEWLTNFILNTGYNDETRNDMEKMNFEMWLKLAIRDRLTFGALGIERIYRKDGLLHSFLPVPTETVYYANKRLSEDTIKTMSDLNRQVFYAGAESSLDKEEIDEQERLNEKLKTGDYEYVQVIEGRIVRGFTRKEMVYKLGNPQNFIDNNGYAIGELEMATTTITTHLQAHNYNRLFFTHGFASRGLIHIRGDITPSSLQAFRAQWAAQIASNTNSWRTPILAGAEDVQWVPLSSSPRDLEFPNYLDHIIRTLCSLFHISPMEFGFDYLTRGSDQRSLSESDNQWKVKESKSRGLKPLLIWIENIVNDDILPYANPKLAAKYRFSFVGLDAESKMEEINRLQAETACHASMNDIRKEIDKDPILGGDLPLNQQYVANLAKYCKVSEIREFFLGKGQGTAAEFDYIADPFYFQNRTMMMQLMNPQQENSEGGNNSNNPQQENDRQESSNALPNEENQLEQLVTDYLEKHPDLIKRSLEKTITLSANNPNKINRRFDKIVDGNLDAAKDIQKRMVKELLESIKGEIVDDDSKENK